MTRRLIRVVVLAVAVFAARMVQVRVSAWSDRGDRRLGATWPPQPKTEGA